MIIIICLQYVILFEVIQCNIDNCQCFILFHWILIFVDYFHCQSKPFRFGLVTLFNGISTFVGYLMPKPSF